MTPREFCYWMQGYIELTGDISQGFTPEQMQIVRDHLKLVFHSSIDPTVPGDPALAQAIHDGGSAATTGPTSGLPATEPWQPPPGNGGLTARC